MLLRRQVVPDDSNEATDALRLLGGSACARARARRCRARLRNVVAARLRERERGAVITEASEDAEARRVACRTGCAHPQAAAAINARRGSVAEVIRRDYDLAARD